MIAKNNFTEEDLFRVLARPNVDRMVKLHRDWVTQKKVNDVYDSRNNIVFAKYYGWTWIEFLRAKKEAGYT